MLFDHFGRRSVLISRFCGHLFRAWIPFVSYGLYYTFTEEDKKLIISEGQRSIVIGTFNAITDLPVIPANIMANIRIYRCLPVTRAV